MTDEADTTKVCLPHDALSPLTIPRGVGIFLRHLDAKHEPAAVVAKLCKDHDVRWVTLMGLGIDRPQGESVLRTVEYASACAEVGLDVFLWAYPTPVRPLAETMKVLEGHLNAFPYRGFIFNVEDQYKGKPAATADFLRAMRSRLVGVQSLTGAGYAVRSVHHTIPWDVLAVQCDLYLFEAYQKVTPAQAQSAITDLSKIFRAVGGIGPAFGTESGAKLGPYLDACYLEHGRPRVQTLGIWSWPQLDHREWPQLARFAGLLR